MNKSLRRFLISLVTLCSVYLSGYSDNYVLSAPLIFNGYRNCYNPITKNDTLSLINAFSPSPSFTLPPPVFPIDSLITAHKILCDIDYQRMIANPAQIDYVSTLLPELPDVPRPTAVVNEDAIFQMPIPTPDIPIPDIPVAIKETHWLHKFDGGIQFSQAYLSPNWYQGGSNNLSLIINMLWDVKLNEAYHPNLMFQNTVSYKLGLYSTPQDTYHKYSISEDLFQWNMKFGLKAFRKWFYSLTSQFKTQIINNYGENSLVRKAAFLSPADFNIGLGMTYSHTNKSKSLKFNASIAPLSYNLKTCINDKVDPVQFNIPIGAKTTSEVGSNAELTLDWNLASNINYRSRFFLFSNYKYFLGDWENTISFSINKFLSTQIYAHLRYDTSTEITSGRWRHWMLKEILSFGFRYAFSTK